MVFVHTQHVSTLACAVIYVAMCHYTAPHSHDLASGRVVAAVVATNVLLEVRARREIGGSRVH